MSPDAQTKHGHPATVVCVHSTLGRPDCTQILLTAGIQAHGAAHMQGSDLVPALKRGCDLLLQELIIPAAGAGRQCQQRSLEVDQNMMLRLSAVISVVQQLRKRQPAPGLAHLTPLKPLD